MKTIEHNIKVECIEDALNKIWHHGYEARPADPDNTPHVKKILFKHDGDEISMVIIEYDWEEGIPIPHEQWDDLNTIIHVYTYSWGSDEDESEGCPQRAFRGA